MSRARGDTGRGCECEGSAEPHPWHGLTFPENYERLEADKKKQVQKKRKCVGPVIRYWSVTMPLITELGKEENVDVEG